MEGVQEGEGVTHAETTNVCEAIISEEPAAVGESSSIVYKVVKGHLTFDAVENMLRNPNLQKLSTIAPVQIRAGQVYLYKMKLGEFWNEDGLQWRYKKRSKNPERGVPTMHRESYNLIVQEGKTHREYDKFRRLVFYRYGDKENIGKGDQYVLVHYNGELPKSYPPVVHGNRKSTPEKIAEIRKKAIRQGHTPGKTPVKYVSPGTVNTVCEPSQNNQLMKVRRKLLMSGEKSKLSGGTSEEPFLDANEREGQSSSIHTARNAEKISLLPEIPDAFSTPEKNNEPARHLTENDDDIDDFLETPGAYRKTNKRVRTELAAKIRVGNKPTESYRAAVIDAARQGHGENPGLTPRNKKQARNVSQTVRSEDSRKDDMFDMFELTRSKDFIFMSDTAGFKFKFSFIKVGCVRYGMGHPEMMQHIKSLMEHVNNPVFHYDTTFNVGAFYTTILSLRHPIFSGEPITAVAVMYHELADTKTHTRFLEELKEQIPSLNSQGVIIVSDREQSIRLAISAALPTVTNVSCWNHLRTNVGDWAEKKYGAEEGMKYRNDVTSLLMTESDQHYEQLLNALRVNWSQEFQDYYLHYNHSDVRNNNVGRLRTLGVNEPTNGLTNNPAESMNAAIKPVLTKEGCSFYSASVAMYMYHCYIMLEVQRGFRRLGEYKIKENYNHLASKISYPKNVYDVVDLSAIPSLINDGVFRKDVNRQAVNKPSTLTTREGLAHYLKENNRVDCHSKQAFWTVRDLYNKHQVVTLNPQECSCKERKPCAHIIACLKAAGVHKSKSGVPITELKGGSMEQLYKTTKPKRTGKKGKSVLERVAISQVQAQTLLPLCTPQPRENELLVSLEDIPKLTMKNHLSSHVLKMDSGKMIYMKDWKTLQLALTANEKNVLKRVDPSLLEGKTSWLNDQIISGFCHSVCEGSNSYYIYPTVATLIFDTNEDVTEVLPATHIREALAQADWILIPTKTTLSQHWMLYAVQPEDKAILILDSTGNDEYTDEKGKRLVDFLLRTLDLEESEWSVHMNEGTPHVMDESRQGQDCGVYVAYYMNQLVHNDNLLGSLDPSKYRAKILSEIVKYCLPFSKSHDKCPKCKNNEPSPTAGSTHVDWVECDKCSQWYHAHCVGFDPKNARCCTFVCQNN